VFGLIVNYNGLQRLENGMTAVGGGPGSAPAGAGVPPGGATRLSFTGDMPQNSSMAGRMDGNSAGNGMVPPVEGQVPTMEGGPSGQPPGISTDNSGKGGGMMDENGTPGLFRLFGSGLAGQISWLLPFALIGLFAWWRRPGCLSLNGLKEAGLFSERGLTLLAMGLWLLPGLLYFSFTTGFWHTYYLATIAPPLAALVGIGAAGMYATYRSGGVKGWLLVAAVAVTGFTTVLFLYYDAAWAGLLIPVLLTVIIVITFLLAAIKRRNKSGSGNLSRTLAFCAIGILFVAPLVWAFTPLVYGNSGNLPVAGPNLARSGAGMGNGFHEGGTGVSKLAEYLISHKSKETWIVAVASSNSEGANLIIDTGEPVMSLGGFSGSDQILTVNAFQGLVDAGRIRYVLGSASGGGRGMGSGNSAIFSWVSNQCAEVPAADWDGSMVTSDDGAPSFTNSIAQALPGYSNLPGPGPIGPGNQNTLYDCAGYRGQTSP
jgi:4-amino-4-deoxy-L-arabinose transferase-like glycosyltransferase